MAAFCCRGNEEFEPILFECLHAKEEEEEETQAFDACTTARAAWTLILRNMFICCDLLFVRLLFCDDRRSESAERTRKRARRKNPIRSVLTLKGKP